MTHSAADLVQIVWKILIVAGLVLLNAFFVATEFALVKIRETQLDTLVTRGHRRAKVARSIIANLNSYLSATQLGITMASLGLGWAGQPVFTALLSPLLTLLHVESEAARHSISFAIGFSALTFLHISAGELAPKWMAIQNPLPIALWAARPLKWFYLASYPFNRALNLAAQWLLRQAGIELVSEAKRVHSEEELRLLVATAQKNAGGSALGRDIVQNALELRRRLAREVLRPRQEIVGLDTEASIAECLDVAEKTRYSRFPLCEGGDLDKTLGVIHIKDLYAMRLKARTGAELLPVARKLIYVPETAHLEKLLQLFLERKLHLAMVVDEYGGTVGMVTLENILEELVGPDSRRVRSGKAAAGAHQRYDLGSSWDPPAPRISGNRRRALAPGRHQHGQWLGDIPAGWISQSRGCAHGRRLRTAGRGNGRHARGAIEAL